MASMVLLPEITRKNSLQRPVDAVSSEEEEDHSADDEDNQSSEDAQKQLVVYDPAANGAGEIEPVPDLNEYQPPPFHRNSFPYHSSRVLPSVGAFTVQCANCFKWRFIPTKEKLWAIDKPSIAQPPPGWQRFLRIIGEGSTKFADVYYVAPSGKRLRSMVEVQRHAYLLAGTSRVHGGRGDNVTVFTSNPKTFAGKLCEEASCSYNTASDGTDLGMPGLIEPSAVNPLSWVGPDENTDLRLGLPGLSTPFPDSEPAKKKKIGYHFGSTVRHEDCSFGPDSKIGMVNISLELAEQSKGSHRPHHCIQCSVCFFTRKPFVLTSLQQ
ncbi:methyl-CPG-binding domain protein 02 [Actinidia rufa]|uniref:Methyl-CPG-binding domain protein 02 n=1 Tax=Actinidia rufa TaxID=165716 RepID=A0A7J0HFR5_9ERIC|nr:methyl-CPG-binding domain protein 02 [Actinidia rufa]